MEKIEKKVMPIDINKKVEKDLNYIKNDLVCKQNKKRFDINEKGEKEYITLYMKFSKPLNAVSVMNMPKTQYIKYWSTIYKEYPEKLKVILNAIEEKFKNQLLTAEEMIKYINNSNDYLTEKRTAINLIIQKS